MTSRAQDPRSRDADLRGARLHHPQQDAGVDKITSTSSSRARKFRTRARRACFRARRCEAVRIDPARITDFVAFEPANAIKFTIQRPSSGSPGEHDVFGAQQYPPLFDVMVP
jgi:hypothetical protein